MKLLGDEQSFRMGWFQPQSPGGPSRRQERHIERLGAGKRVCAHSGHLSKVINPLGHPLFSGIQREFRGSGRPDLQFAPGVGKEGDDLALKHVGQMLDRGLEDGRLPRVLASFRLSACREAVRRSRSCDVVTAARSCVVNVLMVRAIRSMTRNVKRYWVSATAKLWNGGTKKKSKDRTPRIEARMAGPRPSRHATVMMAMR